MTWCKEALVETWVIDGDDAHNIKCPFVKVKGDDCNVKRPG